MSQDEMGDRKSMAFGPLVAWAWSETAPVHRNRTNLLIHAIAVPLFVAGHVLVLVSFFTTWWLALVGVASVPVSLALQKHGHALERQPVIPFEDRRDFVRRLYAEQFINFWRFVGSGHWWASLRSSGDATLPSSRKNA